MPFPSKDVKMNQKLKSVQRVQVSKPAACGSNRTSIPVPIPSKSRNVPLPVAAARSKCQTIQSEASFRSSGVRERCHYTYLTLLDVSKMNRAASPLSRILPTEEFVPNSYHQGFHIARWRKWLNETPQVQISVYLLEYLVRRIKKAQCSKVPTSHSFFGGGEGSWLNIKNGCHNFTHHCGFGVVILL